ncbi:hypothetical protein H5A44_21460 [Pectobacterium brasiliense]|uniref:hypothetical protein n=1 Tax=Pectobacterium brasiliense TaxID=180957 RepID=UPI001969A727|nr:hypothetical protein [Pectobacterium brasiliense]MBN3344976.1 hypothetical protein [Pectobacterium brasiliense]
MAIIFASILLTGCAIDTSRDTDLNSFEGISFTKKGQAEYIENYTKKFDRTVYSIEKLKICTLRNVTNRDVRLSDTSNSFVGAYTGNYYNINSSSNISGGDVLSLSDDNGLVVNGTTSYIFDAGIISVKRFVRFTLDIVNKDKITEYTFSNIQFAQAETGTLPNDGFNDIGTWKMASPAQSILSLSNIAKNINDCANH